MVDETIDFTVREDGDVLIAEVTGKVVGEQAARLKRSLARAVDGLPAEQAPAVVIQLKSVPFLDSEGLGAIVRTRQAVVQRGGRLALAGARENIRRLLTVAKLTEVLPNYDQEAEAIAAVAGARQDA